MADEKLSGAEQKQLLRLARETIAQHLRTGKTRHTQPTSSCLAASCGAFVSLHKRGELRGCIGTFTGRGSLVDTVQEMAVAAAQSDPRFLALTLDELEEIDIEISVLSPSRQIDDVSAIEVGRHGILVNRDFYSGVLLPQVATENGWDRETFLQQTCRKANLPADAWKDPKTRIEIFEAQVFGEQD